MFARYRAGVLAVMALLALSLAGSAAARPLEIGRAHV